jgi:hypothetical protein
VILPLADPDIASATMSIHLDTVWANRKLQEVGWERQQVDELHTMVTIPARNVAGEVHPYYVKFGAEHYDLYPPTVLIVAPTEGWPRARAGTPWWPVVAGLPPWIGLHDSYPYAENGQLRFEAQLVCVSVTAEYYISNHGPTAAQRWRQGRHTVSATLSRLEEILSPPYYQGPSAARPA